METLKKKTSEQAVWALWEAAMGFAPLCGRPHSYREALRALWQLLFPGWESREGVACLDGEVSQFGAKVSDSGRLCRYLEFRCSPRKPILGNL